MFKRDSGGVSRFHLHDISITALFLKINGSMKKNVAVLDKTPVEQGIVAP